MTTNFPNGVTSFGVPVMGAGLPSTFGQVWFVDYRNGSDDNNGKSTDRAFKTLSKAYDKAVTNRNDVIAIDGDSTVAEDSMITWAKNRIHVVGLNGPAGHFGQGAKVQIGITTAATDIALLKVTGVRNTFSNVNSSPTTLKQKVFTLLQITVNIQDTLIVSSISQLT